RHPFVRQGKPSIELGALLPKLVHNLVARSPVDRLSATSSALSGELEPAFPPAVRSLSDQSLTRSTPSSHSTLPLRDARCASPTAHPPAMPTRTPVEDARPALENPSDADATRAQPADAPPQASKRSRRRRPARSLRLALGVSSRREYSRTRTRKAKFRIGCGL